MANYRARILNTEAAADATVHFDCWIQRETADPPPDNWVNVLNGHRTLVLQASAIKAITQNPALTDNQKRAQLAELFRIEATSWGIDEADDANGSIIALIPDGSWPVNVGL